jgi:hypothetical protein
MAKKERKNRVITANVANFEELVSVKRSIYPWESLVEDPGGNFFVECDDETEARTLKSSVNSSGLNYYLKRKINLVPVTTVAKLGEKFGVVCMVIVAE